ncbi:substrate-binding domain-containing protein [Burkholderia perseverans]|uniref:substrate-binding domain-containing protein n=1 Tax=Burkholderia perseverans TaxID=2615214 RepID=UPI001FEF7B6E|nr:substrate-binding domain-containing protein [Burkholderia perseverans]
MKIEKRRIALALAFVTSNFGAIAAMAAGPVIQGGGSSLVAPAIWAEIANFGTSVGAFTYYSADSAAGQNAFLNNLPALLAPGLGGTVDFANSDAALPSGASSTSGPLIQIPYIVTAITIPVVNNGQTITSTATPQTTPGQLHSIALNDSDLCGIFSGKLTNWNQVTNPETGTLYPTSRPITVVYRTDGSGTNELLTRHLSQVCTTGTGGNSNVAFVDSMTFIDSFPGMAVPSNFLGAGSSSGVRAAITNASSATVAYLSPAYTNTFLAPTSSVTTSAGAAQLQVASLLNANDGRYYAPAYPNATTALGTITPPTTRPRAATPANWVPAAGNPTTGYPVSGTSQIIVSQCYLDPNVAVAMVVFLASHYTNSSYAAIVHGNGFDTVPAAYLTQIENDFLSNASGFNLDINNSSVCVGIGR